MSGYRAAMYPTRTEPLPLSSWLVT